ncbi:hypothetical protein T05_15464 [Trichinella murrelli]|uniref:Uncharacterized protein n=1 Tax=Trichinella murrelli TaxID=144512 RepID=A0A0V0T9A6_9BILA|nr:hypothetical protein T05_15464 [Trichinella murrelli]
MHFYGICQEVFGALALYQGGNLTAAHVCWSSAGVAKVVDIDPFGSMGLSKGSIKA